MKSKVVNIPIYECKLTIIFTHDLSEVAKKYNLEGKWGKYGAFTFEDKSKYIMCQILMILNARL